MLRVQAYIVADDNICRVIFHPATIYALDREYVQLVPAYIVAGDNMCSGDNICRNRPLFIRTYTEFRNLFERCIRS